MSEKCQVCDYTSASYHFGAIVCRACAAFFRRFVNTKKRTIHCNCFIKRVDSYPCRSCRIEKCLAVGMQTSEVLGPREGNSSPNQNIVDVEATCSGLVLIERTIKPKTIDKISLVAQKYRNLELSRNLIFKRNDGSIRREINLHDFTQEIKTDIKLTWKFCQMAFPEYERLSQVDQKTLFYNFCIKWNFLETAMYCAKYNDHSCHFYSPSGGITKPVGEFYKSNARGNISQDEIARIFGPIWNSHIQSVLVPLVALKLSEMENMALFGIMLWDPSYTNLNKELTETCHTMRKIIFRELRSYYENKEALESGRFFETLDSLNLIERSEEQCRREIELCGVYNIDIDQERRNMILWEKY